MANDNNSGTQNSFFSMVNGQSEANTADESTSTDRLSDDAAAHEMLEDSAPSADQDWADDDAPSSENSDMPHDARRVLVHLMRQGVVIASQKPKLFALVCRYEVFVRRHLSEVYLQLVLDQKSGVAFVATSASEHAATSHSPGEDDDETDEFSTLIARRTLSLYDTLILLVLRKHYQDRESAGEQKITIDIERLASYLTPFLPITDHASKDRKKLLARVKEMIRRKILSTIRGSEDRYEITPVIRYVVSADFLASMLAEYKKLASAQAE